VDDEVDQGATAPDARAESVATAETLTSNDSAAPAVTGAQPHPGTQLARYQLITRLGAGAMGEVWTANDPELDRTIAIKLVHPKFGSSPYLAGRLKREARAMAKVSHPGVVVIHDVGEVDGQLFLAMEFVRGRTLGGLLRERGETSGADWRRWLAIMIEAGRGLAAAHAAGVLHRDFKPDNACEDFAVDASGQRLLVCNQRHAFEIVGDDVREYPVPAGTTLRSVAFDPKGGLLIGGAADAVAYVVIALDGDRKTELIRSDGEILSLVRPSASGDQISFVGRSYGTELWSYTR